jgi:hypothetical protein
VQKVPFLPGQSIIRQQLVIDVALQVLNSRVILVPEHRCGFFVQNSRMLFLLLVDAFENCHIEHLLLARSEILEIVNTVAHVPPK